MRLKIRIFLLLIPLVLLPALGVAFAAFKSLEQSAKALLYKEVNVLLEQIAISEKKLIHSSEAYVQILTANPSIRRYAGTPDPYARYRILQPTLYRLMDGLQTQYPDLIAVQVVLESGEVDFSYPSDSNLGLEIDDQFLEKSVAAPHQTLTFLSRLPSGDHALNVISPLLAENGDATDSYLVVQQSLERMKQQMAQTHIADHGRIAYVRKHGEPIFAYPEAWMTRDLSGVILEHILDAAKVSTGVATKVNGNNYVVASREIMADLNVIGVLPGHVLTHTLNGLALKVTLITLLIILTTYFLVYLAVNQSLIKPILRLSAIAQKIGNYEIEGQSTVRHDRFDELSALATSLNSMSNHLEQSHQTIKQLASYDVLTGLPNRSTFKDLLDTAIARAAREERTLAILCIDLDNFKWVNDTFGHDSGDDLIKAMSARLQECLRQEDTVGRADSDAIVSQILGRFGGDEFFVMLERVSKTYQTTVVARRILNEVCKPLELEGKEIFVTASIGITVYPHDGNEAETLLRNADAAMYSAKNDEKNSYQFFTSTMNESAKKKLILENSLRKALEIDEFELYYQPQVCSVTGKIKGAEALIRWISKEHGMVFPDVFIPLAEETGLIKDIGRWVIKTACTQNKQWIEQGYEPIKVSVNLSAKQLTGNQPGKVVHDVLEQTGLEPKYLELEITESSLMADEGAAINLLSDVRNLGVSVALDDFGTGYSSLSYLRKFPLDILKIDRTFVKDLDESDEAKIIAKSIIQMAHGLKLSIVAEGVETAEHLQYMRENKVDLIQGYYFSKPIPAAEFEKLLASKHHFELGVASRERA